MLTDTELKALSDRLLRDTCFHSNPSAGLRHEAARKMMQAGDQCLDWIMRQLREGMFHWQWISMAATLTDYDPVQPQSRGKVEWVRKDYVNWYFGEETETGLTRAVLGLRILTRGGCRSFENRPGDTHYTTCRDEDSGRCKGGQWSAEAWCESCVAQDALEGLVEAGIIEGERE